MPQLKRVRLLHPSLSLACAFALVLALIGLQASSAAEVGTNDFQISSMGNADASGELGNFSSAAAYNSAANEYLAVWSGDDITPVGTGDFEVFGQRLNGTTGAKIGSAFQISSMGTGANAGSRDATNPAVAYNPGNNEWLVVWEGDNATDGELDIYSNRIKIGAGGATAPQGQVRISDMGDTTTAYDAVEPDVACHTTNGTCMVVWSGNEAGASFAPDELEIFGTIVQASGSPASTKSYVQLSDMGTNGSGAYDAKTPAITYNATTSQYLVVWSGNDFVSATADQEFEIYGQLTSAVGAATGANDFRITNIGTPGETDANRASFDADTPDVAVDSAGAFMVIFSADDDWTGPVGAGENEIYGQLVSSTGSTTLDSHFRLSDMGVDGINNNTAVNPAIVYAGAVNEYLVAWQGDDTTDNELEIYGQRVNSTGAEVGANDFRISDMGPDGNANYDAALPALAFNSTGRQYLAVWTGDDNAGGLVDEQIEVFGQRIEFNPPTVTNVNSVPGTGDGSLAENESTGVPITQLLISFSETVSNTETTSNYLLINNGTDNTFQTSTCGAPQGDDTTIAIDSADYLTATSTVTLTVSGGALTPDGYRLFACATNLTDADGNMLDGNGDGTAGDHFVRNFTISAPVPLADLALSKVASHSSIALGSGQVTYTLTITNSGPATSSAVVLTDTLPSSATVASVDAGSGTTCTQPAGLVRCELGDLANGATKTITVSVTPNAAGTLINNAVVGSATIDSNNDNNSDEATTTVTAPTGTADLTVTAGAPSQLLLGSTKTYTFTVTNGGPDTAAIVQFSGTTPSGLEVISIDSSVGTCSVNPTTGATLCNLGNLASGASARVYITVQGTSTGSKNLSATVSSGTDDPTTSNNGTQQVVIVEQMKVFLPIVRR